MYIRKLTSIFNSYYIHLGWESEKNKSENSLSDEPRFHDFHDAALDGDIECIKRLLNEGMSPDAECSNDRCYNSPLHHAALGKYIELMDLLLSNGATINKKGKRDETPLHVAAGAGNLKAMKMLLSNGAGVNRTDTDGLTPLHRAVQFDNVAPAKLLLLYGADMYVKSLDGKTALDHARYWDRKETVRILELAMHYRPIH